MAVTVDPADLATVSEMAALFGVKRSAVSMWVHRSASNGFPAPAIETAGGTRLWSVGEVRRWLAEG